MIAISLFALRAAFTRPNLDLARGPARQLRWQLVETIRSGQIFALYLFDVAEAINLQAATDLVAGSVRAKLEPKPPTPAYLQYQQPPLVFDGSAVELPTIEGFRVGFKVFDYGVISLRLATDFTGTWSELSATAQKRIEDEGLERQAEHACRTLAKRLERALARPREAPL